jgi:hypothetical protein
VYSRPVTSSVTSSIIDLFDVFDQVSGGGSGNVLIPTTSLQSTSSFPVGPSYTPARLTTPEYGNRWGHTPAEVKAVVKPVKSSIQTLDALVQTVVAGVGIHHIESIPKTCEVCIITC